MLSAQNVQPHILPKQFYTNSALMTSCLMNVLHLHFDASKVEESD